MKETFHLLINDPQGVVAQCSLEASSIHAANLRWRVDISGETYGGLHGEGDDLFDALCDLRSKLDAVGCKLLCNGARRDVWPSGMARDMGHARKAYITRIGHPAERADLVDIFAPTEAMLVGTVEEQALYREAWIESLKQ